MEKISQMMADGDSHADERVWRDGLLPRFLTGLPPLPDPEIGWQAMSDLHQKRLAIFRRWKKTQAAGHGQRMSESDSRSWTTQVHLPEGGRLGRFGRMGIVLT